MYGCAKIQGLYYIKSARENSSGMQHPVLKYAGSPSLWEFSPVGMSADDHDVVITVPTVVILLNLVASRPAFEGLAAYLTPDVQKAPDVSNHEKETIAGHLINLLGDREPQRFLALFPVF